MSRYQDPRFDGVDEYGMDSRTVKYADLHKVQGRLAYASDCLVPHAYEQVVWYYPIEGLTYETIAAIRGGEQHSGYWEAVENLVTDGYVKDESGEYWEVVQSHVTGRIVLVRSV